MIVGVIHFIWCLLPDFAKSCLNFFKFWSTIKKNLQFKGLFTELSPEGNSLCWPLHHISILSNILILLIFSGNRISLLFIYFDILFFSIVLIDFDELIWETTFENDSNYYKIHKILNKFFWQNWKKVQKSINITISFAII